MTSERPQRRPWLQFRLRTLLIAVLLLSLPLSWFAVRMARARRQRAVVHAVERADGCVLFMGRSSVNRCRLEKILPAWLDEHAKDAIFSDVVVEVYFRSRVSDAMLKRLGDLPTLESLTLDGTPVNGSQLRHLKGLTSLHYLSLRDTPVTDADLVHVNALPLLGLRLTGTQITDTALRHVSGMSHIGRLEIGHTQITDAGLEYVAKLTRLVDLDISHTLITDPGLKHLEGLTDLWYLDLEGTRITDSGLKHLKPLSHLKQLNMLGTRVTPEGIRAALPRLGGIATCTPKRREARGTHSSIGDEVLACLLLAGSVPRPARGSSCRQCVGTARDRKPRAAKP